MGVSHSRPVYAIGRKTKTQMIPVRVSPLLAWTVALMGIVITAMLWVVSAPIVTAFYNAMGSDLPEQAQGPSTTLRLQFIIFPVIICVGLVVWAFLVTTRRQVVTRPGGYY